MPTIDLSTGAGDASPRTVTGTLPRLEAAPRRIGLTLRELREAARRADVALPWDDVAAPGEAAATADRLGSRLGARHPDDAHAHRAAVDALRDPGETLARRGLLTGGPGGLDDGLRGALDLLAAGGVALDVDVVVDEVRLRAWYRRTADPVDAVASLATIDGTVFELAWFAGRDWAGELARVATAPDGAGPQTRRPAAAGAAPAVPAWVDLPLELADAGAEAVRRGRVDLLPVLAQRYSGATRGPEGAEGAEGAEAALGDDDVVAVLMGLSTRSRGRLRALVADVRDLRGDAASGAVGVVAWTLLDDGWRALRAHRDDGEARLEVRAVEPADLATCVAPALAAAQRGAAA